MENKTKSKIIIEMNHLDHAGKLLQAIQEIKKHASRGGDLTIRIDAACSAEYGFELIGHDVEIKRVQHIIYDY